MKCNPLRWLWALPVIALIWWLAQTGERTRIEADLATRTQQALAAAGQTWATTAFSGRDAVLRGKSFDEADRSRAVEAVRSTWGVRLVEDRSALAELQKNFQWTVASDARRVVISGFLPDERIRADVVAAVKAASGNREIVDEMQAARGGPNRDVWLSGVAFAARQFARLAPGGRVALDGSRLTIEGEAADMAAFKTVKSALSGRLPAGITLASDRVWPPIVRPFTWSAKLATGQIEFSGHAPNENMRDALLARAKAMLPTAAIIDRLTVAGGAPEGFADAAGVLLTELARLERGEAALSATTATFIGETEKEETARQVSRTLRERLPSGYTVTPQIKFRAPEIPLQQPFETSIVANAETVTVDGFVPNEDARKALLELAAQKWPNRRVSDRLRYARGAPEGWRSCLQAGFEGLGALVTGSAKLIDRNLRIEGVTDDEDTAEKLPGVVRAAANRACQDEVVLTLNVPPEPDIEWRASRQDKELVLDGLVTDSATKTALAAAAERLFPGLTITDRTRIAPAKSRKWPRVANAALAMLARLRGGEAVVSGQLLRITGTARDATVVTVIANQMRDGLPKGYRGQDYLTVVSDAMLWAEQEARRKAEADARRAGEERARREADEQRRREEAEAAARRRSEAEAEQRRKAEADARRAAAADAEEARRRAAAEAEERRKAEAEAEARRKAEAEERRRREAAEAEQRRAQAAREARVKEADRCQGALNAAAAQGVIRFARASAELESASHQTLDSLVAVARTCPDFRIEVEGHTDAEGTDERNARLSNRRASAVVDYLVDRGVERGRITAIGYGASRPIGDNGTAEGRARNRRIEFKVNPD